MFLSVLDRDIIASELIPHATYTTGAWLGFDLHLDYQGEPIDPIPAAPTVSPFDLAFYLSEDDRLSPEDRNLGFVMSDCVSQILSHGLNNGDQVIVQDNKGW